MEPSLTPLPGGWSGRTFVGEVAGERSVVRIYPPGLVGHPPEVDAALLRLVRGLVPVPDVLEIRPVSDQEPGLLVTALVPGRRGDELIGDLDDASFEALGRSLGAVAGTLAGMPFLAAGEFVDEALAVRPFAGAAEGLPGWVASHCHRLFRFTPDELAGLTEIAEHAQDLLDRVDRISLVHSDFNPKNVLVDPDTLAVTALVDWEFAHAGHPFTDLGNLMRFDRVPAYVDAILGAYVDLRGGSTGEALDLARAADLFALVDLASRELDNLVTQLAHGLLRAIAGARDLHAVQSE